MNPKICIVFNGGALGDFLLSLLYSQLNVELKFELNGNGSVKKTPGHAFKMACKNFYLSNFDKAVFDNCPDYEIVNSHYYFSDMSLLFPQCTFYYIDDSKYHTTTINAFIQKRALHHFKSLSNWFYLNNKFGHLNNKFKSLKENKKITNDMIIRVMEKNWSKNTKNWEELGLKRINLLDIVVKENCRSLIENMLQLDINEESFSATFDNWALKNEIFINSIKQQTYE